MIGSRLCLQCKVFDNGIWRMPCLMWIRNFFQSIESSWWFTTSAFVLLAYCSCFITMLLIRFTHICRHRGCVWFDTFSPLSDYTANWYLNHVCLVRPVNSYHINRSQRKSPLIPPTPGRKQITLQLRSCRAAHRDRSIRPRWLGPLCDDSAPYLVHPGERRRWSRAIPRSTLLHEQAGGGAMRGAARRRRWWSRH